MQKVANFICSNKTKINYDCEKKSKNYYPVNKQFFSLLNSTPTLPIFEKSDFHIFAKYFY